MLVTAEELMAGSELIFDIAIPPEILHPAPPGAVPNGSVAKSIRLRPLTVRDVQLIAKAAKDDEVLTSVLMIQRAVVGPPLKQDQIAAMHSGLIRFLVDHINHVSGLATTEDDLRDIADSPIVRAFFVLAREFNWTPQQVREMTIGQVLGYLELLNQAQREARPG